MLPVKSFQAEETSSPSTPRTEVRKTQRKQNKATRKAEHITAQNPVSEDADTQMDPVWNQFGCCCLKGEPGRRSQSERESPWWNVSKRRLIEEEPITAQDPGGSRVNRVVFSVLLFGSCCVRPLLSTWIIQVHSGAERRRFEAQHLQLVPGVENFERKISATAASEISI